MRPSNALMLAVALCILIAGILSIYSSTYQKEGKVWQEIYRRQIVWACAGILFYVVFARMNYRRLWEATYLLYVITVLLLVTVCLLGIIRLGAQRWIRIGAFNFQPSELAKLTVVLFVSRYFSRRSLKRMAAAVSEMGFLRAFILPSLLVLVPVGLVVEQPDLGSGMLIMIVFIIMSYLAGVRGWYLGACLGVVTAMLPVFWHFLHGYQKDRLLVFLNPNIDPLGAGYTIIQAKIAIGSGGFFGKGWLAGTQSQLRFLPEAHTDFVFSTFAEEWGFVGCALLLGLYYILIRQGFAVARRTSDYFGRLLAYGISLMLAVQVCVNVAMNMGFAPVVGVPLPLMSYGGSSMFVTWIALGILASINRRRTV